MIEMRQGPDVEEYDTLDSKGRTKVPNLRSEKLILDQYGLHSDARNMMKLDKAIKRPTSYSHSKNFSSVFSIQEDTSQHKK